VFLPTVSSTSGIRSAQVGLNRVRSGLPTKSPTVPPCISASAGLSETIVSLAASTTVIPRLVRLKQISHMSRSVSPSISARPSRRMTITSLSFPPSSRIARQAASHLTQEPSLWRQR